MLGNSHYKYGPCNKLQIMNEILSFYSFLLLGGIGPRNQQWLCLSSYPEIIGML